MRFEQQSNYVFKRRDLSDFFVGFYPTCKRRGAARYMGWHKENGAKNRPV